MAATAKRSSGYRIPQLELGVLMISDRMKNDADVDFVIDDQTMQTLKSIETIKDYGAFSFFPVFGGEMG